MKTFKSVCSDLLKQATKLETISDEQWDTASTKFYLRGYQLYEMIKGYLKDNPDLEKVHPQYKEAFNKFGVK